MCIYNYWDCWRCEVLLIFVPLLTFLMCNPSSSSYIDNKESFISWNFTILNMQVFVAKYNIPKSWSSYYSQETFPINYNPPPPPPHRRLLWRQYKKYFFLFQPFSNSKIMNSKNLKFLHNSGKSGSQYRHFHKGKAHKRIVLYWSNPSEGRKKSLSYKKLYLRFNQGFPDNFMILSHNFQTVFDTEIKSKLKLRKMHKLNSLTLYTASFKKG